MNKISISVKNVLILDFILLILGLYNLNYLPDKATLPEFTDSENSTINNIILPNDVILKIDNFEINKSSKLETILDFYKSGDIIKLVVLRNSNIITFDIELVKYYNFLFIPITVFVMLFFLFPAVFIYNKIEDRLVAGVFHGMMVSVVVMLLFTYGSVSDSHYLITIIIRTLDQISYLSLSITFLHFSLLFPDRKFLKILKLFKYVYIILGLLLIPLFVVNYIYIKNPGIEIFEIYDIINFSILKPSFIPMYILVVINVIHSYVKSSSSENKAKLLWIIVSVIWGPSMYILLYLIPGLIIKDGAISESVMELLIIISPISLFISIYKYSVFDIRLFIKRSFVYGLIFTILISLYIFLIFIFSEFIISEKSQLQFAGITTILLTLLFFHQIKIRVQKFVDYRVFNIHYDYVNVNNQTSLSLKNCLSIAEIVSEFRIFTDYYIKPESYQFLIFETSKNNLVPYSDSATSLHTHQVYNLLNLLRKHPEKFIISKSDVFSDKVDFVEDSQIMSIIDAEIVLYSFADNSEPETVIVYGKKLNGTLYTNDDIEIIKHFAIESGNIYRKLEFQKELLFRNEEIKKLEELNNIKNHFISNVSHELKTPLTAISLFSELMINNNQLSNDKRLEYLNIVVGECQRLTRLINNVLDFSKIERGAKEYNFREIDLNEIVTEVVMSTSYMISMKKFKLNFEQNIEKYYIWGDEDALKEVVYNLIDNAIKYSVKNKEISIRTYNKENNYYFEIEDRGIGIKEEHQKAIFDAYFRVRSNETNSISGTGLGMSIVNNIIHAHNGQIYLKSQYEVGTTFIIEFTGVT